MGKGGRDDGRLRRPAAGAACRACARPCGAAAPRPGSTLWCVPLPTTNNPGMPCMRHHRGKGALRGALATQRGAFPPAAPPRWCWPCAACSGRLRYAGPIARPLPCPALGPFGCPWPGLRSGCGCRSGTAAPGNQSPGLLPCLSGALPPVARGAAAPRPPRCAGGCGPSAARAPVPSGRGIMAPGARVRAPRPAGGPCARVPWLAPLPRPGARAGGSPRPRLFPSLLPPGGAAAAGAVKPAPFTASPPPRARRAGFPLRRERLRW